MGKSVGKPRLPTLSVNPGQYPTMGKSVGKPRPWMREYHEWEKPYHGEVRREATAKGRVALWEASNPTMGKSVGKPRRPSVRPISSRYPSTGKSVGKPRPPSGDVTPLRNPTLGKSVGKPRRTSRRRVCKSHPTLGKSVGKPRPSLEAGRDGATLPPGRPAKPAPRARHSGEHRLTRLCQRDLGLAHRVPRDDRPKRGVPRFFFPADIIFLVVGHG